VPSPSAKHLAARLLLQTTFGATTEKVNAVAASITAKGAAAAAKDFIHAEFAKPATSHRAHFRARANPRITGQNFAAGGPRSACDQKSLWKGFAFSEEDEGSVVTVSQGIGGKFKLHVAGRCVTELPGSTDWTTMPAVPITVTSCTASSEVSGSGCDKAFDGSAGTKWQRAQSNVWPSEGNTWIQANFNGPKQISQVWTKQWERSVSTPWVGDYVDSYQDVEFEFSDGSTQRFKLSPTVGRISLQPPVTTTFVKLKMLSVYDKGYTANYHVWRITRLQYYHHNNTLPFTSKSYKLCRVIPKVGGNILLTDVAATAGACKSPASHNSPFTTNVISEQASLLANPNISFPPVDPGDSDATAANTVEYSTNQATVEASVFDIGSVVLRSRSGACNKPYAKYMKLGTKYYKHDPRLKLAANTPSEPVTTPTSINFINTTSIHKQEAGRWNRCPDVPMNPFNRANCKRSIACLPLVWDTKIFPLNEANLRQFYLLSSRYVYYVTGLKLENPYAISPCTGTSRWKKLSGNCAANGGETGVDADTKIALVSAINGTTDQLNPFVRDAHVTGTCNAANGGVSTIGAKVEVNGICWQHVHAKEYSVFDFSYFSEMHEGNSNFLVSENPIHKWAKAGGVNIQFPASHPMSRWASITGHMQPHFILIGRYGDSADFRLLPADVQTNELAAHIGSAGRIPTGMQDSCGSPGEAANDPANGNHYQIQYKRSGTLYSKTYLTYGPSDARQMVWYTSVMRASDSLRQRAAWVLAQIYVMSGTDGDEAFTEIWGSMYDVFVRNAFGNLRGVLRQVSFNAMMGRYLTFIGGTSFGQSGSWPDENYARELMQLFSIGPDKLFPNGTTQRDSFGAPVPTYGNDDVMAFARVWTGFTASGYRGNLEYFHYGNYIDPMAIDASKHDAFPKQNLYGGYLGDGYPLCTDLPSRAWLHKGATFRYLGLRWPLPTRMKFGDPAFGGPDLTLASNSTLYGQLCSRESSGICRFPAEVVLSSKAQCDGDECDIDQPNILRLEFNGTLQAFYQYVPHPCVQLTVYNHGQAIHQTRGSDLCANPLLPVAGASCCNPSWSLNPSNTRQYNPSEHCKFKWESTTYSTAHARCDAAGLKVCKGFSVAGLPSAVRPDFNNCPPRAPLEYGWSPGVWGHCRAADGGPANTCDYAWNNQGVWKGVVYVSGFYSWTDNPCKVQVQVQPSGMVSVIHNNSNLDGRYKANPGNAYKVPWTAGSFPAASTSCAPACTVSSETCICDVTEVVTAVFTNSSELPAYQEVKSQLHIASPSLDMYDAGVYNLCTTAVCSASSDVTVYLKNGGSQFDTTTVFKILVHGAPVYLLNKVSMVQVGSTHSFRNAPTFASLITNDQTGAGHVRGSPMEAENEVFALLDHLLYHPNTPPFIAKRIIQRMVTSNPSPNYIEAVSEAFRTGNYSGHTYSGQYGCLAATFAAVLQHREARPFVLEEDPTHGRLREPLMKLLQLLTGMDYVSASNHRTGTGPQEFHLRWLQNKISQAPFSAPTVFGFYSPTYSPKGPVQAADYVAPEMELTSAPTNIAYLNGMVSLIKNGLVDCIHPNNGFGMMDWTGNGDWIGRSCQGPTAKAGGMSSENNSGEMKWRPSTWQTPATIIAEMDVLLTGGRLNPHTMSVVVDAFTTKRDDDASCAIASGAYPPCLSAMRLAQVMIISSAEFQATNKNQPTAIPRSLPPKIASGGRPYKAIVLMHLNGGADSWNMIVPHSGCSGTQYDDYAAARGQGAYKKANLLTITVPESQQPCSTWGLNPKLTGIRTLYNDGDALFVANTGPMVEHMDKAQYQAGAKRVPYGLFGHAGQQEDAKSVHSGKGSTAHGILGRISKAMASHTTPYATNLYSMHGNQKSTDGGLTPADILAATAAGVNRFNYNPEYAPHIAKALSQNQTSSIFGETFAAGLQESLNRTETLGGILSSITTTTIPNSATGGEMGQMRHVARIIKARDQIQSERDVFHVESFGWDTHFDRFAGPEAKYLAIDDALTKFATEMKAAGVWDKVTVVLTSDFGRTMSPNSGGTDHGWGGNYIVLGGQMKDSTFLGTWPDLKTGSTTDLGRGRQLPTRSWESIWTGVAEWFGVESGQMADALPNLAKFPAGWGFTKAQMYDAGA